MKKWNRYLILGLMLLCCAGTVQAQQKKTGKKKAVVTKTKKKTKSSKKSAVNSRQPSVGNKQPVTGNRQPATTPVVLSQNTADTAPRTVVITSAFKPSLKSAAKQLFTAASPVVDSSRLPVQYVIPSQNLFFSFQPVPIKPLALPVDSGYTWNNDQYIKLGAGNLSTVLGQAAFSFGDGKNNITNIKGNFLTTQGKLPAQQAARWGLDVISVFNAAGTHEWTAHPYYKSNTQYFYGYQPATLNYAKETLLQRYSDVGIELGMQNKTDNAFGIHYQPEISAYRYFDNHEVHENGIRMALPLEKHFGRLYSIDVKAIADISSANIPLIPNPLTLKNNLYSVQTAFRFTTPNVKLKLGITPSWDNSQFAALPDLAAEMRLADIGISLEAGWKGRFQKNSYRSLTGFNPWVNNFFNGLVNTRIQEQFAGIKGVKGDHFRYEARVSLLQLKNQALFLNNSGDGKSFQVLYEPDMRAVRLHGEIAYVEGEKLSFTTGATYTNFNNLSVNSKPWGLLPLELNSSLQWKLLKDLLLKTEVYIWDGNDYRDSTGTAKKAKAAADLNFGVEFTVLPRLNVWVQMNNLLNSSYQRWNQYPSNGFTVLGGVVYSFR
jgi:hypothetical protein